MDGGHNHHGEQEPAWGCAGQQPGGDALARMAAAARARNASDVDTLADSGYLTGLLATVNAVIEEVAGVRWAALGPLQVAAMLRQLHCARARLDAAVLRAVKAVDDRDDVIPGARAGTAAATFLHRGVGLERSQAGLDADAARLLDPDAGDLAQVGASYAAGDITRGHVDICVRVHRRLKASVRDALIPVADADTGEQGERRCIEVVDVTLARQARAFGVPEFRRIADRLIEHLDPPTPAGAHERRYLNLSVLPDGSLQGRFACGPAQALAFTAVIAAGAAPQPGVGVDEHGVEHPIPDERGRGQRQLDALVDALNAGTAGTGASGAENDDTSAEREAAPQTEQPDQPDEPSGPEDTGAPEQPEPEPWEPIEPRPEGDYQIRRSPGVRTAPYPAVEIIVTATLDQLAAARALARRPTSGNEHDPPGLWPDTAPRGAPPVGRGLQQPGLEEVEGFARAQHGGPVHPSTLALLACTGRLRRVLLDPHGAVLHLGRSQRLASPW